MYLPDITTNSEDWYHSTMAMYRQRVHDRKMLRLAEENKELVNDVDKLESTLALHANLQGQRDPSLRKESSIWQHGGEGKLSTYKSSKDLGKKWNPNVTRTIVSKEKRVSTPTKRSENLDLNPSVEKIVTKKQSKPLNQRPKSESVRLSKGGVKESVPSFDQKKVSSSVASSRLGTTVTLCKKNTPVKSSSIASATRSVKIPQVGPHLVSDSELDESLMKSDTPNDESRVEVLSKMMNNLKGSWNIATHKLNQQNTSDSKVKNGKLNSDSRSKSSHGEAQAKPFDPCVAEWLEGLKLRDTERYIKIFVENEMDMDSVLSLSEQQLKEMGISAVGARSKILRSVNEIKQKSPHPSSVDTHHETVEDKPFEKSFLGVTRVLNKDSQISNNASTPQSISHKDVDTGPVTPGPFSKTSSAKKTQSAVEHGRKQRVRTDCVIKSKSAVEKTEGSEPAPHSEASEQRKHIVPSVTVRSTRASRLRRGGGRTLGGAGLGAHEEAACGEGRHDHSSIVNTAMQDISPVSTDNEAAVEDSLPRSVARENAQTTGKQPSSDSAHAPDFTSLKIDGLALGATKDEASGEQDQLNNIEQEIQMLCYDMGNPDVMDKINQLSVQLKELQRNILEQKNLQDNVQPDAKTPKVTNINEHAAENVEKENAETASGNEERPSVVSQKMSKYDLLKEVRKQKEQHRREIRHLESELSRLKHKDPLRSCEVMEADIYFLEEDLIGEGAFSKVYRGFYQGSEVAIKQLKVPLTAQDKNYFMAEVNLLKDLRHPRVVLLVGVCTTIRFPLMVLEFMSKGSLYDYLHNPENESLDHIDYYQIALDTALGMNYLHMHRSAVLHLDLKSMNILLTAHLRAKIADFGFSKLKHDASVAAKRSDSKQKSSGSPATVKGTPAWLAPELIQHREVTTKADVYSFAVILCEMLTRQHPYPGCSVFQILERVRNNKRPELPEFCPPPLAALISRCWDQNPARRPPFKSILTSLTQLQLPSEWQSLFARAGVPAAALDDPSTTRTLIQLVTQHLPDTPHPQHQAHCQAEQQEPSQAPTSQAPASQDSQHLPDIQGPNQGQNSYTKAHYQGHTKDSNGWSTGNLVAKHRQDKNKNGGLKQEDNKIRNNSYGEDKKGVVNASPGGAGYISARSSRSAWSARSLGEAEVTETHARPEGVPALRLYGSGKGFSSDESTLSEDQTDRSLLLHDLEQDEEERPESAVFISKQEAEFYALLANQLSSPLAYNDYEDEQSQYSLTERDISRTQSARNTSQADAPCSSRRAPTDNDCYTPRSHSARTKSHSDAPLSSRRAGNFSGGDDTHRRRSARTKSETDTPLSSRRADSVSSGGSSARDPSRASSFDFERPPCAPLPPPIPSFNWGGKQPSSLDEPVYDDLFQAALLTSHQAKQSKSDLTGSRDRKQGSAAHKKNGADSGLRASQLARTRAQLRSVVEPVSCGKEAQPSQASVAGLSRSSIRASLLRNQRDKLQPTDKPHPNQLTDLSGVDQGHLDNLAEILRKAVSERRVAIDDNTATLDSMETANWSLG